MPKPTASANIRAEMARRDVSQSSIAELLGVSPGQVSARIQGRVTWRLPEVQAIAAYLKIPVATLIDDIPGATDDDSAVA